MCQYKNEWISGLNCLKFQAVFLQFPHSRCLAYSQQFTKTVGRAALFHGSPQQLFFKHVQQDRQLMAAYEGTVILGGSIVIW